METKTRKTPGLDQEAETPSRARRSIATRIILVEMIIMLVAMGAYGYQSYARMSRQLSQSLQAREKQMGQRLSASLSIPLWNMDNASMDTIVSFEMADPDVMAIVVTTDAGVRGKVKNAKGAPADYTDSDPARLSGAGIQKLVTEISFQDKTIGNVASYFSNASVKASLQAELLRTAGVTLAVILVLAAATLLVTRFMLSKPFALVDSAVERVARGDLSRSVEFHSGDELGRLAAGVNEMIDQLRAMVVKIRGTADLLAGSSARFSDHSRQLATSAQSQAATLEETSAAVEELTSSVEQVAAHAQSQASSVERSSTSMKDMRASAENVSAKLKDVSRSSQESLRMARSGVEAVNATVKAIQDISQKSGQIASIVTVISDIADQTNLLALNASIEAARAGEHGRGFAVVAQEVSKLAERSAVSTREIKDLISDSEKNVVNGVKIAEGALSAMNAIISGAQNTNQTIVAFSQDIEAQMQSISSVAASIDSVTEMSHSISAATEEQTTNARQVASAVENVNDLTQQAAVAAAEMSEATAELTSLSSQLKGLVEQFAVGEASSAGAPVLAPVPAGAVQR